MYLEHRAAKFHNYHDNEVVHLAKQCGIKALFENKCSVLLQSPFDQVSVCNIIGLLGKFRADVLTLLNLRINTFLASLSNPEERYAPFTVINSVQQSMSVATSRDSTHFAPPGIAGTRQTKEITIR